MQRSVPEETKQTLLDAFWKLYCDKPIEKITVREVTDTAGFNRGTFYVYFTDVYDALRTIEDSILPGEEEVERLLEDHRIEQDFQTSMQEFMQFYETHGEKLQVLLGPNGDPTFGARMKKQVRSYLIQATPELRDADPKTQLQFEYLIESEISSRLGALTLWFQRGKDLPIEELHKLIYNMIHQGSLTTAYELLERKDDLS
ncbi:TetR/AcrR family transcriptional regulator [Alkalicoccus urumqiensis]|uniref:TetR/AcrR family transcriptional regulator n=1 Tax=Alkalicoccus urumqiensis TaxID=1548213 RepID=A0A2P6MJS1_ALKUR|nr:TetR/AcrR family transcriptional regulator [Alkalicoccus urumqiensis]PRO66524.1 TetR/AcrR family transcriptional regulator [Alkalicoccus urumqiensis]